MKQGDPDESGGWFNAKKIIYNKPTAGYPRDVELASSMLIVNGTYTVSRTKVWSAYSEVELIEFPGVWFNTVHFTELVS